MVLIGKTPVVFNMRVDIMREVRITDFVDTDLIVLVTKGSRCLKSIVGFLEEVEREGKEQRCSDPEDSDQHEIRVLVFSVPSHFLNTLPESDVLLANLRPVMLGGRLILGRVTFFEFFN